MIELVKKEKPEGIWAGDMKDGDIGVVVAWSCGDLYLDRIVQRYKNFLLTIGASSGYGWSNVFNNAKCNISENCRVRLLEKGETLIVT